VTSRPVPARAVRHCLRNRLLAAACVTLALVTATLVANPASATSAAGAGCSSAATSTPTRVGRIGGIVHPLHTSSRCVGADPLNAGVEAPFLVGANPPLIWHGGPMMSTQATGDRVVVTPIFWEPAGFAFTASYKSLITTYLTDLAADSGKVTNVFATLFEYDGSNGPINYQMSVGTPIDDTTAFPTDGCTVQAGDTTHIYADNTGYSRCLDDAQVQAELNAKVAANSLPSDLGHLYVMLLPKHVESCFNAGSTASSLNACTLNHQPSAAFCAYHSQATNGSVYANMPFPAYKSGTGFSCTAEGLDGGAATIQSPNGDPDADVEISPLSHEMAEAITDPDVQTGWYDQPTATDGGNENGDNCAYIYGALSGTAGLHFNQTVNGHHYLTQEEFSNQGFNSGGAPCLQGVAAVTPVVATLSPTSGPAGGGGHLTITGTGFPGATAVHFGAASATYTILDATHLDVTIPPGNGVVDVTVSTSVGTSAATPADQYTYGPTVTTVSPASGPAAGGQRVTITGTGFSDGATVAFGSSVGKSVTVVSPTTITVTSPKHAKGSVDVHVTTAAGTSPVSAADRYTYLAHPKVTGLSRTSGTHQGGTKVTITGRHFTAGSTVLFGGTAVKKVRIVSATKITVTSPHHAKGRVHVTVRNLGGHSRRSKVDRYTFT
jgi:hypothetical protein